VSRLERVGVMDEIKTQFDFLGGVLAASISKDKSLLQALVREAKSKGAEEAQAIDKSKPMTFAELKSAQDQNEANYKNSFKAYLKQLRAKGADTTDQDAVIDNFHKQYGKSKNPDSLPNSSRDSCVFSQISIRHLLRTPLYGHHDHFGDTRCATRAPRTW